MNPLINYPSISRNELMYALDYGFSPGNGGGTHVAPPPDYSQPSLPHLHHPKFSALGPPPSSAFVEGNSISSTSFSNGMDNELYNLLINASEREFPVELDGNLAPRGLKGLPSAEKRLAASAASSSAEQSAGPSPAEGRNRTSRKRRLAETMNSSPPKQQPPSSISNTNPNITDDLDESPEDSEEVGPRDDQAKRVRRLVKNREAAQLFRQRQKAYIGDLEVKVDKLSTENVTLQSKVDLLSAENKLIKEQLGYLRNFISQVTMTLPFSQNQQIRETGFARKIGFDSKYQ